MWMERQITGDVRALNTISEEISDVSPSLVDRRSSLELAFLDWRIFGNDISSVTKQTEKYFCVLLFTIDRFLV